MPILLQDRPQLRLVAPGVPLILKRRILHFVLSIGLFAVPGFGAEAVTTIHASVNEVRLIIVATDSSSRPLSKLSPGEFSVFDDGHRVSHFDLRSSSDLPLCVGIVLDLSGSMQKAWPVLRNSLASPLRGLLRPQDEVLVVAFDSKVELDNTVNISQQFSFLDIPQSGGLTALYDTLYLVCRKRMLADSADPRHSALIVFSDGEDNLSRHNLEDVTESAESAGIAIYSISSQKPQLRTGGDVVLQQLAVATGGRSFVAANPSELQAALAIIQDELRSSYLLYYQTQGQPVDRKFRSIKLVPVDQQGPNLRSRAGYYVAP
jgi:Ca-activated chloride channel homolog